MTSALLIVIAAGLSKAPQKPAAPPRAPFESPSKLREELPAAAAPDPRATAKPQPEASPIAPPSATGAKPAAATPAPPSAPAPEPIAAKLHEDAPLDPPPSAAPQANPVAARPASPPAALGAKVAASLIPAPKRAAPPRPLSPADKLLRTEVLLPVIGGAGLGIASAICFGYASQNRSLLERGAAYSRSDAERIASAGSNFQIAAWVAAIAGSGALVYGIYEIDVPPAKVSLQVGPGGVGFAWRLP